MVTKIKPGYTVIGNKKIEGLKIPKHAKDFDGDTAVCCRFFVVGGKDPQGVLESYAKVCKNIETDKENKLESGLINTDNKRFFEMLVYLGRFKKNSYAYTCLNLDREKGQCKIYKDRPYICVKYTVCEHEGCKTANICSATRDFEVKKDQDVQKEMQVDEKCRTCSNKKCRDCNEKSDI